LRRRNGEYARQQDKACEAKNIGRRFPDHRRLLFF
jgi:hypothetical protein